MTLDTIRSRSALRIGAGVLALCAAGAEAQTRIEQGDRLISYQLRPAPPGSGVDVVFRVELRDRNLRDPTGGRSLSGEAALNCAAGLTRLKMMTVHAEPGLRGAVVQQVPRQTSWMQPETGSLLRVIMTSACKTPGAAAPGPARSANPPATIALAPRPAQASPQPTAPRATSGPAASSVVASSPASTGGSTSTAAQPRPNAGAGRFRIQVGSYPSEVEARAQAERVRRAHAQLDAPRLEAAQVAGRTYYRVLIDGFADRGQPMRPARA